MTAGAKTPAAMLVQGETTAQVTGTPAQLDLTLFRQVLLDSAGVGLAVLNRDDLRLIFRNRRLAEWFPETEPGHVPEDLLEKINQATLEAELNAGRSYTVELEIKPKRRTISLALTFSLAAENASAVFLEVQNVSKLRELEYMIESYAHMVERQNRDLRKEKERVEKVLLNIMPRSVYEEWKTFGVTTPTRFEAASILMLDFVDFTEMSLSHDPTALIGELNDIFTAFDRIVDEFGAERLKTIGDAYVAVCGLPEASPDHAQSLANVALRFVRFIERRNAQHKQTWRCRIGINTGPVIGSIVGVQKYVYDIFGPGVNLASRLEELAEPMQILITDSTWQLIRTEFRARDLGETEIKGFGAQRIYALEAGPEVALRGSV
ncbi:MAG: adenylate/guanylate cyclase domain-containing protein [Kiloniellales bacterium]